MRPIRLQNGVNWNYYRGMEFFSPCTVHSSDGMRLVKRLKREFPVDVVKATVLYGVQKLGYDQPTVDQSSILQAFLLGQDVFASLPTGSGKSLCYASCSILRV